MRIIKLLLFLLISCQVAFATDTALAEVLESLTAHQRTILYQYGTLSAYASSAEADNFWKEHQQEVSNVNQQQAGLLATELLSNTELVYTMQKPSRLQALRGVFTASRMLLGVAALIGTYALLQLLGKYLPQLFKGIVRYLSPLFRWLFSPRMLAWELFLAGLAAVYFGPWVPELIIRTSIIHVGLFLIWTQLTAILTRQYLIKKYVDVLRNSFHHHNKPLQAFLHVTVPAIVTSLAILWVMQVCEDNWYPYEVIIPVMIGIFALPPLRRMEVALNRLLFPFSNNLLRVNDRRVAAYVVIGLVIWIVLLLLPVVIMETLFVLTVFLTGMLLLLSVENTTTCGIKNYLWLQVVILVFLVSAVLAGSQLGTPLISWTGLGGVLIYGLIKYWEVPVLLGWSWKNKKGWGALGMALLIWGVAVLIRSRPEWFAMFP